MAVYHVHRALIPFSPKRKADPVNHPARIDGKQSLPCSNVAMTKTEPTTKETYQRQVALDGADENIDRLKER